MRGEQTINGNEIGLDLKLEAFFWSSHDFLGRRPPQKIRRGTVRPVTHKIYEINVK